LFSQKNTFVFPDPVTKFVPVIVPEKFCPAVGVLGFRVKPVNVGPACALETVSGHEFEGVPDAPFLTCTVKLPDESTAAPESCVEVRFRPETTQELFVGHPGPRKKTSVLEMKLFPETVKLKG
jgi:hypothetical protein